MKRQKGWRMGCDVDEVTESLELNSFSKLSVTSPTSQLILILQAFHHFTYVTGHSPTLPLLYLQNNSFSNPSIASPMSQLILQPFFRLSYVTGFSLTSPGEPPMKWPCTCRLGHVFTYNSNIHKSSDISAGSGRMSSARRAGLQWTRGIWSFVLW